MDPLASNNRKHDGLIILNFQILGIKPESYLSCNQINRKNRSLAILIKVADIWNSGGENLKYGNRDPRLYRNTGMDTDTTTKTTSPLIGKNFSYFSDR